MHLLIPFAAPLSDAGRQALASLTPTGLDHLLGWLGGAREVQRDSGDELSLTPPHERAQAQAMGLVAADGRLPWAALQAPRDGIDPGASAWGLLTPVHWHVGTDQVSLLDPAALSLDEAGSRALLAAVEDLFTSEGFGLVYGAPERWYVQHDSLAELACASIDRVIGRNVDRWLNAGEGSRQAARLIRRLQNEVQMRLYEHPLNEARQARGQLVVNSFWLSGCGRLPVLTPPSDLVVDERLRSPALADDWAAWVKAWDSLDDGPVAALHQAARGGEPTRLTLCGERSSATFEGQPPRWWHRLWPRLRRGALLPLLEGL